MSALTLCELLGFVVQRVDHFAHVLYRLQRRLVRLVHHRLLEDDQHSFTLVQNTCVRDTQRFLSSVHPGNKKKKSAKCKVTAAKRCGQASTKHGQVRQKFTVRVKGVQGGWPHRETSRPGSSATASAPRLPADHRKQDFRNCVSSRDVDT